MGDVFSYLIVDEKNVLVDCGHHAPEAYENVQHNLQKCGLTTGDVDEIWLTHGHPDHYGQAARIARESNAVVYGHSKERANFAGNEDKALFQDFFAAQHLPEILADRMIEQLDWLQQYQLPVKPRWVEHGQQLTSGTLTVSVKTTPGHAPGHLVFDTGEGVLFGGDLLLEHISTNALINFDPDTGRRNKSLLQYRNSLWWMARRKGTVLPGHGKVIRNIPAIANRHLQEQENRYREIFMLLRKQPMSLLQISEHLFADAIKEGAIFLVLSEVLGYLDWGETEGKIQKEETDKAVTYLTVGDTE